MRYSTRFFTFVWNKKISNMELLEVYDYGLDTSGRSCWCEVHHAHRTPTFHKFPIRDLVIMACTRLGVAHDDVSNEEVMIIHNPGDPHERTSYEPVKDWYEAYVTANDYLNLVQQEALYGQAWEEAN